MSVVGNLARKARSFITDAPATGLFENGAPMDINELQDRFVQLRFNEIKVEHEELDDETITRNQE